jgi:hypothetical protein
MMTIRWWQDLVFGGTLAVTLDVAGYPDYPDGFLVDHGQVGLARFGTTRQAPQSLWLGPPRILFNCKAVASGTGELTAWRVGLLQRISHASWSGYYANGERLRFRLNTDHGPLKDGRSGSLWYRWTRRFEPGSTPGFLEAVFDDEDSTQAMFWREFSGDPFDPQAGTPGRLVRTEGEWRFRTFLAAVNESARVVVTLAECHWDLTWCGEYDFDARSWRPSGSGSMITHREFDQAGVYQNPVAAASPLPFSLFLDAALQTWEVETLQGWVLCRKCRPTPDAEDRPTFVRWGA